MTPLQIKLIHVAFGQVKKLRPDVHDDQWYRLVLRNIGHAKPDAAGHVSSKSLTQAGFEDVMAFFEANGYREPERPETRWRDIANRRIGYASTRQVHAIRDLATRVPYTLDALCLKFSDGRARFPERLTPRQAHSLVEMLKSASARAAKKPAGVVEGGATTGDTAGLNLEDTTPQATVNANSASQEESC